MYNEEANAERCVRTLTQELSRMPYRTGLIVVDDGSTDGTPTILKRLEAEVPSLTVVTHDFNLGYGGATRTGIAYAKLGAYDYILFMDSDLTNDPKYIAAFAMRMLEGVEVIKASRYVTGGGMVGVPRYRVVISVAGNAVARRLMGVPVADCTNGFRAMKVEVASRMPLRENGFAVIMEELYYCKYLARTFAEIPHILTCRGEGSGSKFSYRPRMFWAYFKYALRAFLLRQPKVFLHERSTA